ncbi:MAG TPA: tetratricopeptide repeat protein [Blastocatellia bacterium]|nr:tetratricopeptide repeat protein [Blastocatellia bacterium]
MKSFCRLLWEFVCPLALLLALAFTATSCSSVQSATEPALAKPCALALTTQSGTTALDQEIAHWQQKARSEKKDAAQMSLEQLGWKYVEKARATYDPGYFKLAEACAECLNERNGQATPEALLLRGHALHQMHNFKAAEPIARELVKARGLSFDHGLLGDVLMEQGKLKEAIAAYQEMMNQKPNLQAYSRAAHVRWLQGDVAGAAKLALMAAQAGSPQDRESTAWAFTRLALYHWQLGNTEKAQQALTAALNLQKDYAPALLVQGRLLLAEEKFGAAIAPLQQAVALNPLPEYQWALAEALRGAGRTDEAVKVETELTTKGAQDDPRTLSLFLATRNEASEHALRLAQTELAARADVFTYDALAWALRAVGKTTEAQDAMKKALAEGTQDARLFYHAGVIAAQTKRKAEAQRYFKQAYASRQLLLPSERGDLIRQMAAIQS